MNRIVSILVALMAFLAIGSTASVAVALSDDEKAALREAVKEGSEAYADGRFLDAVEAFERAEKISKDPRVQYNLGRALEEAGHCTSAMKRFESLVENEETEKRVLEMARAKVDDGLTCTPRGNLTFVCETAGATIEVDGQKVACGDTLRRETAELSWSAAAPGFLPANGTVTPVEAQTISVVVALEPQPAAEGANWKTFAGLGMLGAGIGAIAIGAVSDSTATGRSERIVTAAENGDRDRLARLQDDAQSSKVQTIILYSAGSALAVGGIVLLVVDFGEETDPVALSPTVSGDGAGVQARWQW